MRKNLVDKFAGTTAGRMEDLDDGHMKVLKIFSKRDFYRILDIGHGDGNFSVLLRKVSNAREIYGVDCSPEAVRSAAKKGIRSFLVNIDEQNLPLKSNYFDAIFAGYVIEHLFNPDQLLDEIYRVLKPGGLFILATPNLSSLYNRIALLIGFQPFSTAVSLRHDVGHMIKFYTTLSSSDHIKVFTYRSIIELLKIHQFDIIQTIGVKIPVGPLSLAKMSDKIRLKSFIEFVDRVLAQFPSLSYAVIVCCRKHHVRHLHPSRNASARQGVAKLV
jgi:SAM-dependent methyltransferase